MRAARSTKNLINIPKRFFAGGGDVKKLDPNLKDFDVLFVGGLNTAIIVKHFQVKHFHGTIAAACQRSRFYNQHHYEYLLAGTIKPFKYSSLPFTSLYETKGVKNISNSIVDIRPDKNEVVTSKGEVFKYKALVLNTGLKQEVTDDPLLDRLTANDPFGTTRVFVNDTGNIAQVNRNMRIFVTHKDGDFIIYIPPGPNRRESYQHQYLSADNYLAKGLFLSGRSKAMRIRVITPNDHLFRFPFANELMLDEISNRSMIDVHFGMELVNIEVKDTYNGQQKRAYFRDLKTGKTVEMDFGTFLTTPKNVKRQIYQNNDVADEDGLVKVNPYSLQHVKYPNIFAYGDCTNVPTTRSLYATLNQSVVIRNNVSDYLTGEPMKAVYEGYSSFMVTFAHDRIYIFKHHYDYRPTAWNFYVPRLLGYVAYKLKISLERQYFTRIYSKKPNNGYPYIQKDRYFRPIEENRFVQQKKLTYRDVFPHEYKKPELSYDSHHGHDGHHHHATSH